MFTTSITGTTPKIASLLTLSCGAFITLTLLAVDDSASDLDAPAKSGLETKSVRVTTRREGELTHFWVENMEQCEVTMTFEMSLVNLKGSVEFPYTATFPPAKVTEAFTL